MRASPQLPSVLLIVAGAAGVACGSDGNQLTNPPLAVPNFVDLDSDAGDGIGAGRTYEYTQADAVITVTATGNHLTLAISGDEGWTGEFQAPDAVTELVPGLYDDLTRYPFHDPAKGGLSWYGEGRGCNTLTGWFAIDSVTYVNTDLVAIDLRFEQHCEGGAPALHGTIHWRSDDATLPPGPALPIPAVLWKPAPGSTPATGDYVYLESEAGDYVGGGATLTHTAGNSTIVVTLTDGHLVVTIGGTHTWNGDFQAMNTISDIEPGYYPGLHRYPFHNPVKGGLSWYGDGRGCNTLTGWFAVDNVSYSSGNLLSAIDLRFEQHCEGGTPALHGAIHMAG